MYFPDMSSYAYALAAALDDVKNVGWLDGSHPFNKGDVSADAVRKLRWMAEFHPVRQMRGFHVCELCNQPWVRHGESLDALGSAEIWVPAGNSAFFASPDLIVHYIEDHGYAPPHTFLKSVLEVSETEFTRDLRRESSDLVMRMFVGPTKLVDVVASLAATDDELTIYVLGPWACDSPVVVAREPEQGGLPAEAAAVGADYFIEVSIAREFIDDWIAREARPISVRERCERLIHYANTDALPRWQMPWGSLERTPRCSFPMPGRRLSRAPSSWWLKCWHSV